MVASEAVPFAKTGGLADVVGALPRFLAELGHDVRVVMPRYTKVLLRENGIKFEKVVPLLGVPMGIMGELWCSVWESQLPESEVPIYFIEFEQYYGRNRIYTDARGEGFLDNDNRFVFLSRAAMQLAKALHFKPDILHANDWHTAAVPVFLNTLYRNDPVFKDAASVLTLHNLQHQGVYYRGLMDVLGVGWQHFNYLELEYHRTVNLLKGGLYHATLLNTVSAGYADEIQTPAFGYGLEGVIRDRADDLRGILNGIDYDLWNPETDPLLAANYSHLALQGKAVCKQALQVEMGLPVRDVPVFGLVSRFVNQKGIDVLAGIIDRLLEMDIQIVMLGSGEWWAHVFFPEVRERHPKQFACQLGYNDELVHRIEAGADFFLMPSRFEPCGLNQLYSLRYGALPIVHAVGGLDDTVENYDDRGGSGTGFKFWGLTRTSLYDTIGWATYTWYNRPEHVEAMIRRGMQQRFTWNDSALGYEKLYEDALARRRG